MSEPSYNRYRYRPVYGYIRHADTFNGYEPGFQGACMDLYRAANSYLAGTWYEQTAVKPTGYGINNIARTH